MSDTVAGLLTPEAVRERCHQVLAAAEVGNLDHFNLNADRIDAVADYVVATMRENYPDLKIPFHSRWRHFVVDGADRWQEPGRNLDADPMERMRVRFDLAVISVLLDAGAGDIWQYRDPESGKTMARSEGLAIASLNMFAAGIFSDDRAKPLRADASALTALSVDQIARGFQASLENPLAGLEGRAALVRRLGEALAAKPIYFGSDRPRIGNLADYLTARAEDNKIAARDVLIAILDGLGPIWPGRVTLEDVNLGDTWRHPAATASDATNGLVPFHKLSQWLTYSLLEPLQEGGFEVTGLDALTGLAEYRNGGLMIDLGLLSPKSADAAGGPHDVGSTLIVEWRALTVALLDRIADQIRGILGVDSLQLPLASVLEGGTWSAGRKAARERRADGAPPIAIVSDGSVF